MTSNAQSRGAPSLLERAATHFDLAPAPMPAIPVPAIPGQELSVAPEAVADPLPLPLPHAASPVDAPAPEQHAPRAAKPGVRPWFGDRYPIDRERLIAAGLIQPDGEVTNTSEEFRIVKRQVLAQAFGLSAEARGNYVLVNSAHPGDGKSWVAINLALSLAAEQEMEVLLVDADFGKPTICERLGLPVGPGLMDALVDPRVAVEDFVLHTDVPTLSILPAGRQVRNDTEFLASERTRAVLDELTARHPRRIVIFDSPPALAASPASELARHVGQTLVVVRADRTSEAALRDAVNLLSACPNIKLLLNGVQFSSSGRLFGSYYGGSGS